MFSKLCQYNYYSFCNNWWIKKRASRSWTLWSIFDIPKLGISLIFYSRLYLWRERLDHPLYVAINFRWSTKRFRSTWPILLSSHCLQQVEIFFLFFTKKYCKRSLLMTPRMSFQIFCNTGKVNAFDCDKADAKVESRIFLCCFFDKLLICFSKKVITTNIGSDIMNMFRLWLLLRQIYISWCRISYIIP